MIFDMFSTLFTGSLDRSIPKPVNKVIFINVFLPNKISKVKRKVKVIVHMLSAIRDYEILL
jgi:hypothetical protein